MKKSTQATVFAAAVCIALGGVLMGAGVAAGGREQVASGKFMLVNMGSSDHVLEQLVEEHIFAPEVGGTWKGQDQESGREVLNGDFVRTIASGSMPEKLKVSLGIHSLTIEESDEDEILLQGENCDRIQCYVKKDTLYIKDVGKNKKYRDVHERTLTLVVPKGTFWEEAEIDADLGSVEIDRLEAQKVELDADLGQITIDTLFAGRHLEVEAELGSVEIKEGHVKKADFTASMGSIQYTGLIDGDAEAEAEMGSIEMYLAQTEFDFDFEIKVGMGNVEMHGTESSFSYSGMEKEKKIRNGAGQKMEISASMGSIVIFFE